MASIDAEFTACNARAAHAPAKDGPGAHRRCMVGKLIGFADLLRDGGQSGTATSILEQIDDVRARAFPSDDALDLEVVSRLAPLYDAAGDVEKDGAVYERLLQLREKNGTADDALRTTALRVSAAAAFERGRYADAAERFEKLAAIQSASPALAGALAKTELQLGASYARAGDDARAIPAYDRAERGFQTSGLATAEPARFALLLSGRARIDIARARYADARDRAAQANALVAPLLAGAQARIDAAKTKAADAATAGAPAAARVSARENATAVDLRSQALASQIAILGAVGGGGPQADRHDPLVRDLVDVTACAEDLALLSAALGDITSADPTLRRALSIDAANVGTQHPSVALDQNNLGTILYSKGDFEGARSSFDAALAVLEITRGKDHPEVAGALQNAALARLALGSAADAEALFIRAIAIYERVLGKNHPKIAVVDHNLAEAKRAQGKLGEALASERSAYTILRAIYGDRHPGVAASLASMARLSAANGDLKTALGEAAESGAAIEASTETVLGLGSEAEKLAYFESEWRETSGLVSLHLRSATASDDAASTALTAVLRRKGRVLDAVSESARAVRERALPEDRVLLDRLAAARASLARAVIAGPEGESLATFGARIDALQTDIRSIEDAASHSSATFLAGTALPVTIADVQKRLHPKQALVEITLFRPFDGHATQESESWGAPRYAAYVLRGSGAPAGIELGGEAEVNELVRRLRMVLADRSSSDVDRRTASQALYAVVFRPLQAMLGDADEVVLAPDGALDLVPFEALIDEGGHYLVERLLLSYLTSGRDLVRPQTMGRAPAAAEIFADPDFDAPEPASSAAVDAMAAEGTPLTRARFEHLPGTSAEASSIRQALGGHATVRVGRDATKDALLALHGPQILHVATHGFFIGLAGAANGADTTRGMSLDLGTASAPGVTPNPLLRSGVALAGANAPGDARVVGIVTALEASGIDLAGTRLVVLSACETGLGDVSGADGVYGLRRAFTIAGAETQVMSMWKVDDDATARLMGMYYAGLAHGGGRANAMRDARLALLRDPTTRHPFFWASFIVSGSPDDLAGGYVAKSVELVAPPRVPPPPRGCACRVGTSSGGTPAPVAGGIAIAVVAMGRRAARRGRARG